MRSARFAYFASLLSIATFIVVRQAIIGQPIFRVEFVLEDLVLLLILARGFVPRSFKPIVGHVISCSIGTIMAIVAWIVGVGKFTMTKTIGMVGVLALLTIYSAVMAVKEYRKLRGSDLKTPATPL
jgi:hypothetical protein